MLNFENLDFIHNNSPNQSVDFGHLFDEWQQKHGTTDTYAYYDIKIPIFARPKLNSLFENLWLWHKKNPQIGLVDLEKEFLIDEEIDFKTDLIHSHDKKLLISDLKIHGLGGTACQEIYFLITEGLKHIKQQDNLRFKLSINSDFFYSMAKVRGFRFIWWRVLEEYGIDPTKNAPIIQLISSYPEQSLLEVEQNILRNFNTAMIGSILGVDEISAFPHTLIAKVKTEEKIRAQRIARNMTLMCTQEAKLNVSKDPALGSTLIDLMTEEMVKMVWDKLRERQNEPEYHLSQEFFDEIAKIKMARNKDYQEQNKIMVGVNKYINDEMSIAKKIELAPELKELYRISESFEKKERGA